MNFTRILSVLAMLVVGCDSFGQVAVLIPNGNEHWDGGTRQYVYWTGAGRLLRVELTTDGGISWTVLSPSVAMGDRMLGFDCPDMSSDECQVRITNIEDTSYTDLSDSTFSIRASALGTAWIQRSGGTLANLLDLTFVDETHGWICGDSGTILATSNGGTIWRPIASGTINLFYSIRFSERSIGIAVGVNGTILRSTDAGLTWQAVPSGTLNTLCGLAFHGDSAVTAVGGNGTILRSRDLGLSWETELSGTTSTLSSISFLDSLHGAITGGDGPLGGGGHFILLTSDAGSSWTLKPTDTDYYAFRSIAYISDSVLMLAGDYSFSFGSRSGLPRSTNGGNSWLDVFGFSNIGSYGPFFSFDKLQFLDSSNGFVVGGGDGCGMFLRTTTGGGSWDLPRAYYFNGYYMHAVCFVTPTNGTIVGTGGAIFQTSSGGLVSIKDNPTQSLARGFRLFQNYPNPFNPTTTIKFAVPTSSFVTLRVFDLLGREVATLVNEEMKVGNYERSLDGRRIATGVYMYQLKAGSFTDTKKLLLLR